MVVQLGDGANGDGGKLMKRMKKKRKKKRKSRRERQHAVGEKEEEGGVKRFRSLKIVATF